MHNLRLRPLRAEDAESLSELLNADDEGYGKHFMPFDFDRESLQHRLYSATNDRYWGLYLDQGLIGFFMLRGLDEGYDLPSFGVYIAASFSGRGLSRMALVSAMCWCRISGIKAIILKVHPENSPARSVYEREGFQHIGICTRTNHLIMEKRWD